MRCPYCKVTIRGIVVNSYELENGKKRHRQRKCRNCGKNYWTTEEIFRGNLKKEKLKR